MRRKLTYILLLFVAGMPSAALFGQTCRFQGVVLDAQTRAALDYATVQLRSSQSAEGYGTITDADGRFVLPAVEPGTYQVMISYLGYEPMKRVTRIASDLTERYTLHATVASLDEVVVTASESKQAVSGSIIDRTAMKHLQPNSFGDLLELLPGGKTREPEMGKAQLIQLREAGTTAPISSLGVGFYIDGIPQNTDAHLQSIPGSTSGINATSTVGKGVDLRTLSTDNIEQIEIIRGIPSVAYGNVTNGAVLIHRKSQAAPLTARFKADKNSKLLSVGKGVRLNVAGTSILNADISYLYATTDPRHSVKNYSRATASVRWEVKRPWNGGQLSSGVSADYTGSFDQARRDKDATVKEDFYQSDYHQWKLTGQWQWKGTNIHVLRECRALVSFSQQKETMHEVKSVSLNRPTAVATRRETGESDGEYLPFQYRASLRVDGRPVYLTTRLHSRWKFPLGSLDNHTLLGAEWNYQANRGDGPVFDPTRPLNENLSTRPRPFHDIPALQNLAVYAEEGLKVSLGTAGRVDLTAGVRLQSLLGLDSRFVLQGKIYPDLRTQIQYHLPTVSGWQVSVSGGWGILSRLPTTAQLYPEDRYVDLVQLNYYHDHPAFRRIQLMTYRWDNRNFLLEAARNRKWEIRSDVSYRGNRLSLTYFRERMNQAFGDLTYYRALPYRFYDPASIDGTTLVAPPELSQFTSIPMQQLDVYTQPGNTLKVEKQGLEFQFASQRLEALKTRMTVYGAWIQTVYRSDVPRYQTASILWNNRQYRYVGLYAENSGTRSESFNTNVVFDTYLQRLGLTFSTSVQSTWYTSRQNLWVSGVPVRYIDPEGKEQPFTEADRHNSLLQPLVENYPSIYFERNVVPFYLDVNIKASKHIGKHLSLSFYVNRLMGIYPDYTSHGVLQRRSTAAPSFGMEMNVTL